jgi:hypothetical protein
MKSTNPKMNGSTLHMRITEGCSELGMGDARAMKIACEKWLRKNDPSYSAPSSFNFGSLRNRARGIPAIGDEPMREAA